MISDFVVDPASPARVARRTLLKSAGGLIAASAVTRLAQAQPDRAALPATGTFRRPQVGFVLSHEQFLDLGVATEQAGLALISTSDHFQPWQPNEGHIGMAWIILSALGQRTKQIAMGTAVTRTTFRYEPAVVAQAFASLATLYPGRVYLGIGSGEALNEVAAAGKWARWAERSDRLVEAAALIRELWKGRARQRARQVLRAQWAPVRYATVAAADPDGGEWSEGDVPRRPVRRWPHHGSEDVEAASRRIRAGREGCGKRASPDPCRDRVLRGCRRQTRRGGSGRAVAISAESVQAVYEIPEPVSIQALARAELPVEEVYRDWPVSVGPDAHVDAIAKLFDSSATAVLVHSGEADQRRVIEFYGAHVLPRLKV
jgi:alkanesulfonate monooxygenase SsuD/methylene tetrahydromethanopterin reductase-like flavin-dependent oxidoreductase (luciferase family)